jgi:CO/xanthine dehydrogenase FAD-binding subunit
VTADGRYAEPASVDEALEALEAGAHVVAGGTDLVVAARSGKSALPESLVAIHRIGELAGLEETADGGLRLGALVTHATLESHPLVRERYTALSDAAALVGSPATRHAGTLGGNLVNGSPAMETGSPLLVYEAEVELASSEGRRTLPLAEFLRGPGQTAIAAGELLTGVVVPPPPPGAASAYLRLEYRQAMEIAVVGAAALVSLDAEHRIVDARLALTAVAPVCLRVPAAEDVLRGAAPDAERLVEAARLAAEAARPIDDVRATARYRRAMVAVIARRTLERALVRAGGGPVEAAA